MLQCIKENHADLANSSSHYALVISTIRVVCKKWQIMLIEVGSMCKKKDVEVDLGNVF